MEDLPPYTQEYENGTSDLMVPAELRCGNPACGNHALPLVLYVTGPDQLWICGGWVTGPDGSAQTTCGQQITDIRLVPTGGGDIPA